MHGLLHRCERAEPFSMESDNNLLKPFVYWGQNKQSVFFKVEIAELDGEPTVEVSEHSLKFSAYGLGVSGKNRFGFKIDFYKPVNVQQSHKKVLGRVVEIECKKKNENEKWPRVTKQTLKLTWLKTDFDRFAFDSSDESSPDDEKLINEAKGSQSTRKLMEQFEREYKEVEADQYYNVRKDLKIIYLIMFSMFQFIGYTYIFCAILYHLIKRTPDSPNNAFHHVGSKMIICQVVAILEIFHSLLGWVRSATSTTVMQVLGRFVILFAIIYPESRMHNKEVVWFLFLTWSVVELVRYPYYIMATMKKEVGLLTWLRYTIWIPLYPLGFVLEGLVMLIALPMFEESGLYDIPLPNNFNISFHFPSILKLYMFLCLPGMYLLMQRMYEQRKRKLNLTFGKGCNSKYGKSF